MKLTNIKKKVDELPAIVKGILYFILLEIGLLFVLWIEIPSFYLLSKLPHISGVSGLLNMLKEVGYFQTWIIISIAFILIDISKRKKSKFEFLKRGVFIISSTLLSGIVAEIFKILIRRERPDPLFFNGSVFREWSGAWWKNNNLGMPSSHAMVGFGAMWALCYMFPQAKIVWIFIGVGCAVSRMAHQAHLLGDVYIAAVLSYFVTLLLKTIIFKKDKQLENCEC